MGDFVELVRRYESEGIDEIVFFDIMVLYEKRGIFLDFVERVVEEIYVFFIVGGGIKSVEEVGEIIK